MNSAASGKPTLILGATGKTGRRVVQRLHARGLPTRLGSRSADPPFDWADAATWTPALDGVGAVYISYYPDLAVPGAVEVVGEFADLAKRRAVRRLVLLAGRGEPEAELAEQAVARTGADLTIVRSTWFSQNFSEDYMLEHVLGGEVALPAGNVAEPFVDAEDIADVAVAALTEGGHAGQLYELTGPRLLTFDDVALEISKATGRDVTYVPVSTSQFAEALAVQEMLPDLVEQLTDLFARVLDGRNAHLTDGVQRALGRQPRDFRDFAEAAATTGVWDA